ncbi:hypothetical protein NDS46_30975 (plasmid) [Paenibacillus thiaminolyticus]|uniref:hypothetical protein n=1 Tax=Paenibacillus thiaminolyticus TaxID=49283 RepID=UPI00232E10A7|nr:hypothetical protein [Paenibacillus thiaminolyticus]WCF11384.1 hypothetical protein NDS46_30975 [Paenibacillus thiaminolyticus]
MSLKELAKIGKSMLRQLSGAVEKYTIVEPLNHEHVCPYAHTDNPKMRELLCNTYCSVANSAEEPKVQVAKYRLSKYQILQLLYYHFLPVDSKGIISCISEKDVAEKLGCTIRTVRNNNVVLSNLELIHYSRYDDQHFNVMIVPYSTYHESKENGGSGYLPLYINHFDLLLKLENVNSLRFELRMLLKFDSDALRRKYGKAEVSEISKKDTEMFMPKYMQTSPMIKQTVEKRSEAFQISMEGNTVFFMMDERFNGKLIKEQNEKLYSSEIQSYLANSQITLTMKADFESLVQLSFEYSLSEVIEALKEWNMEINYNELNKYISNPGGYVRTKIRQARQNKHKRAISAKMTA